MLWPPRPPRLRGHGRSPSSDPRPDPAHPTLPTLSSLRAFPLCSPSWHFPSLPSLLPFKATQSGPHVLSSLHPLPSPLTGHPTMTACLLQLLARHCSSCLQSSSRPLVSLGLPPLWLLLSAPLVSSQAHPSSAAGHPAAPPLLLLPLPGHLPLAFNSFRPTVHSNSWRGCLRTQAGRCGCLHPVHYQQPNPSPRNSHPSSSSMAPTGHLRVVCTALSSNRAQLPGPDLSLAKPAQP